jgi:hypothetical protein
VSSQRALLLLLLLLLKESGHPLRIHERANLRFLFLTTSYFSSHCYPDG